MSEPTSEEVKRKKSWAYGLGKSEGYVAITLIVFATFTGVLVGGKLPSTEYVEACKWLLLSFFGGGIGSVMLKRKNNGR